jgi:beta-lactamase class C
VGLLALAAMFAIDLPARPAAPAPRVEAAQGAVAVVPIAATVPARGPQVDYAPVAHEIEGLAQSVVERKNLPGLAMAIVQGDRVLALRGFGTTVAGGDEPVTPDTVFRLASLSKAFAATLSSLLVQEDAMDWDRPIVERLPAFKLRDYRRAQQVSIRDVLAQKVGLARNTFDRDLEANQPYPLLAERLGTAPMTCSTGDCYGYQNVAFSLIGDLVFAATGDFYTHQVERRIFYPLGMTESTYGRDGLEGSASWARPHVRGGRGWVAQRPNETYYHVPPAAGVNSSARDMAQWLIAQMGNRPDVLSPEVLNPIHTPQVATPGETRGSRWRRERVRSAYYGMGWRVFDYAGHTLLFHGGAVRGYRGLIAFLPDRQVGIVVLWNSESSAPSGLMPSLMDRVLGLPHEDWLGLEEDEGE